MDGLAAYGFGLLYDKLGFRALIGSTLLSALFAPLAFSGSMTLIVAGIVLWGIGMGAQESILRAAVASMVGIERRGTAYGLFNMGYGLCWFVGSALLGLLYDRSLIAMMLLSVVLQLGSVILLALVGTRRVRVEGEENM